MKTVERIRSHNIEFNYFSKSKNAVPDETEISHVEQCLRGNYVEGELCMNKVANNRQYEFKGWWRIQN